MPSGRKNSSFLILHSSFILNSVRIGFQSFAEYNERLRQILFLQDIGHADFIPSQTRCRIESGGRRHHDGLPFVLKLVQAPGAELLGIVYRELGHRIERAHRYRRIAAGDAVQPVDQKLPPLHIFIIDFQHIGFRRVERGFGNNLSNQWRTQPRLAPFHDAALHLLVLRNQRPDADTALAVAFRDGIDQHHVLLDAFQMERRDVGM